MPDPIISKKSLGPAPLPDKRLIKPGAVGGWRCFTCKKFKTGRDCVKCDQITLDTQREN